MSHSAISLGILLQLSLTWTSLLQVRLPLSIAACSSAMVRSLCTILPLPLLASNPAIANSIHYSWFGAAAGETPVCGIIGTSVATCYDVCRHVRTLATLLRIDQRYYQKQNGGQTSGHPQRLQCGCEHAAGIVIATLR